VIRGGFQSLISGAAVLLKEKSAKKTHIPTFGTALVLLAFFAAQLLSGSRLFFEADAWTLSSFSRDEFDAGSLKGSLDLPDCFSSASYLRDTLNPLDRRRAY
jgi:hypothetical protein